MIIKNSFRKVLNSFHRITPSRQLIAIIALLFGLNACYNEPEFLGGNLIPDGDKSSVQITDTFNVAAYTIKTDTLITSDFNVGVLGCYNSELFGSIKSDFYTRFFQYNLSDSLIYVSPRPIPDSLVLTLHLSKTWGVKNSAINIKVYQLSDSIDSKKFYNGLENPKVLNYLTQVDSLTKYNGGETLRIRFKKEFAKTLINAPDSVIKSQRKFMNFMKGLYFTTDSYSALKGVLYSFDVINGEFLMYYMKPTSTGFKKAEYRYVLGYLRFNHFQHDSTTINPALKIRKRSLNSINDNTPQDTVFSIEGLGGVRGLIKLKGVKEWRKLMPLAIHRAELRFDIQNHSEIPTDSTTNKLYFYNYRVFNPETNSVKEFGLYDSKNGSSYNKAKKNYSIDVTLQLQRLICDKINKDYIIVENVDNKNSYMHGLFRTGNNSKPLKLIVTYSKL